MIETIHTLPEMEKTDDGYAYDKKYHNKLYYYKDQFILFREASYDTFPKLIIETVVNSALENISKDLQDSLPNPDLIMEEVLKRVEVVIPKYIPKIESVGITKDDVEKVFDDKIGIAFQNINRVIDNLGDKINSKIELTDLQSWRTSIEQGVNALFQENIQQLPKDSVQIILERLENIENTKIPITLTNEQIKSIVHEELKVVHEGMQSMVETAINNISKPVNVIDNNKNEVLPDISSHTSMPKVCPSKIGSEKIKITTLAMMKESGFSIKEIIEARNSGLI